MPNNPGFISKTHKVKGESRHIPPPKHRKHTNKQINVEAGRGNQQHLFLSFLSLDAACPLGSSVFTMGFLVNSTLASSYPENEIS